MEKVYKAIGRFEEKDVARINALVKSKEKSSKIKSLISLSYEEGKEDAFKGLQFPEKTFSYLIKKFRPEYVKYCPYPITLKELKRGNNMWLQNTKMLGLNHEDHLDLHIDLGTVEEIRPISILWLMLHEFRHHVQVNNPAVGSVTLNYSNYNFWKDKYMLEKGYDSNTLDHVFHDLAPFEIDAYVFPCELLDIQFPGGSFEITNKTLEKLNNNRRISFKQILKYNWKFFKDLFNFKKIKAT